MAKVIMIQGTMSNAGKSILTGGLLRVLRQDGVKAAPFKSQNMALNSFITREGLEMGRAQVMQAEAAMIEPAVQMNPILLKPTNDMGSQVIVNGEVTGTMSAVEYYQRKKEYIPVIMEAYDSLARQYDVIVIEGAGSPAEINLRDDDIVNMGLAAMIDAPVVLVGDIDRGGVFAQIAGTVLLLEEESRRIKGLVINKFRGDKEILKPGLRMLEEKTGIPVCGVIPYVHLDIDDEDSLTERFGRKSGSGMIDVAVIRLPRISNFTDFAALEYRKEISVRYVDSAASFGEPDAVLVPGSKNTIQDLLWMRQNGLEGRIIRHAKRGKLIFGICGGYQMLGESIYDPEGVEHQGEIKGMGLLPIRTVFASQKTRTRVKGQILQTEGILKGMSGAPIEGYEIHMGETSFTTESGRPLLHLEYETNTAAGSKNTRIDGAQAGNVYGCYIHGIFDSAQAAKKIAEALLREKGMDADMAEEIDLQAYKETQYNLLADVIRENMDMKAIYEIIEKGMDAPCSL